MVRGVITIFAGSIAQIPSDWALCDGTQGTPDLRDKFVLGAGLTFAVDSTGGVVAHNHPFTSDGHDHILPAGDGVEAGTDHENKTDVEVDTGTTDNGGSLPPYYSLAYMMKL